MHYCYKISLIKIDGSDLHIIIEWKENKNTYKEIVILSEILSTFTRYLTKESQSSVQTRIIWAKEKGDR